MNMYEEINTIFDNLEESEYILRSWASDPYIDIVVDSVCLARKMLYESVGYMRNANWRKNAKKH